MSIAHPDDGPVQLALTGDPTPKRVCTKCHVELPATTEYFYRRLKGKYGVTSRCKDCERKDASGRYSEAKAGTRRAWVRANPEKNRAYLKTYVQRVRVEVLSHYSPNGTPTCACCGEQAIEFLVLDHINGDGGKHRRAIGPGTNIFRWLRKHNYPEEYHLQVLCHNCNCSKSFYGCCPHQRAKAVG